MHDLSHGAVSEIEKEKGLPEEYSMGRPSTAHRNSVFYQLHGWIDELYASWQRTQGDEPDLTPKQPGGHGHAHDLGLDTFAEGIASKIARAADQVAGFARPLR